MRKSFKPKEKTNYNTMYRTQLEKILTSGNLLKNTFLLLKAFNISFSEKDV